MWIQQLQGTWKRRRPVLSHPAHQYACTQCQPPTPAKGLVVFFPDVFSKQIGCWKTGVKDQPGFSVVSPPNLVHLDDGTQPWLKTASTASSVRFDGWWLVSTHLKNMKVKLEIFPNFRGENIFKKNIWNHHLVCFRTCFYVKWWSKHNDDGKENNFVQLLGYAYDCTWIYTYIYIYVYTLYIFMFHHVLWLFFLYRLESLPLTIEVWKHQFDHLSISVSLK